MATTQSRPRRGIALTASSDTGAIIPNGALRTPQRAVAAVDTSASSDKYRPTQFQLPGRSHGQSPDARGTSRRDAHETAGGDRQVLGDGCSDLPRPHRPDPVPGLAATDDG